MRNPYLLGAKVYLRPLEEADAAERHAWLNDPDSESGYVLIRRDDLLNLTSLEHERWKRAHPECCRQMGIE